MLRRPPRPHAATGGPTDINNRGDVIGAYVDATWVQHGFRIDKRGCFDLVDFPGAPHTLNEAIGVNDPGEIVGAFRNDASPPPPSAENPDVAPDLVASEPAAGRLAVGVPAGGRPILR